MKFFHTLLFLSLITLTAKAQDDGDVSLADRLKSNIFTKVEASNTDCFVGEPIIVTYKLYSALNSESRIIKQPTFSGFDVKDVRQSADETGSRETVDGVAFDVHTLLKLQLTPYKEGKFSLGTIGVRNNVKLVDANGNKDAVLNGIQEDYTLNNGYYTLDISSVPITILVTGLPDNENRGEVNQSGVVGDFKMDVQLSEKILDPGEQATLQITITGNGDFSKIKQPEINWPKGITILPATIDKDDIKADGTGYISFAIPFKTNKPGKYTIPSITFSFFDAITGKYKTITNIPIEFTVGNDGVAIGSAESIAGKNDTGNFLLIIGVTVIAALVLALIFIKRKKKPKRPVSNKTISKNQQHSKSENLVNKIASIDELLLRATNAISSSGNTFFIELKNAVINFLEKKFNLPDSSFNKDALVHAMNKESISAQKQNEINDFISTIDTHIYSGGAFDADRIALLNMAKAIINSF